MKILIYLLLTTVTSFSAAASIVNRHMFPIINNESEDIFSLYSTQANDEVHQVVANFNVKISIKPKEPTNPTNCFVGFSIKGETIMSHTDCDEYNVLVTEEKTY